MYVRDKMYTKKLLEYRLLWYGITLNISNVEIFWNQHVRPRWSEKEMFAERIALQILQILSFSWDCKILTWDYLQRFRHRRDMITFQKIKRWSQAKKCIQNYDVNTSPTWQNRRYAIYHLCLNTLARTLRFDLLLSTILLSPSLARYSLAFFPFHSRGPSAFSYFLRSEDLRNRQPHRNR